jgi:hypothetical protein
MDATPPIFGLLDRLRSALRAGRRARLEPEHVRVLMDEEVYLAISRLEAREMRRLLETADAIDSKSGGSGSGSDRSTSPGISAGLSQTSADALSRGASRLLREEVALTARRKRRSTHSPPTT